MKTWFRANQAALWNTIRLWEPNFRYEKLPEVLHPVVWEHFFRKMVSDIALQVSDHAPEDPREWASGSLTGSNSYAQDGWNACSQEEWSIGYGDSWRRTRWWSDCSDDQEGRATLRRRTEEALTHHPYIVYIYIKREIQAIHACKI